MPLESQDVVAIEQVGERFVEALNRGDVTTLTDILAEDAIIIPARRNPVKGEKSIRRFLLGFAPAIQSAKFMPTDLDPLGSDFAREVGAISFRVSTGKSPRVMGRYLFIWRRSASGWKLATFIWNRNPDAAGAPRELGGVPGA